MNKAPCNKHQVDNFWENKQNKCVFFWYNKRLTEGNMFFSYYSAHLSFSHLCADISVCTLSLKGCFKNALKIRKHLDSALEKANSFFLSTKASIQIRRTLTQIKLVSFRYGYIKPQPFISTFSPCICVCESPFRGSHQTLRAEIYIRLRGLFNP